MSKLKRYCCNCEHMIDGEYKCCRRTEFINWRGDVDYCLCRSIWGKWRCKWRYRYKTNEDKGGN